MQANLSDILERELSASIAEKRMCFAVGDSNFGLSDKEIGAWETQMNDRYVDVLHKITDYKGNDAIKLKMKAVVDILRDAEETPQDKVETARSVADALVWSVVGDLLADLSRPA